MKGFTLIELLIVMAVIAALISTLVPVGVNAIRHAKATSVALNLSEISKAVMSDFYLNHTPATSIQNVKSFFSNQEVLKNYRIKKISSSSSVTKVCVWYSQNDVSAADVKKVFPSVEASGNKPMLCTNLIKYW